MTRSIACSLLVSAMIAAPLRGDSPKTKACLASGESALRLTVRLYDYAKPGEAILARARERADQALAAAGITLRWKSCPLTMEELERNPACNEAAGPTDLIIRLLAPQMREEVSSRTGTFGYALVGDDPMPRTAAVFFGNVERLAWERDEDSAYGQVQRSVSHARYVGIVLGHVMAHEIGHLLLATNEHSREGLMQAHWDAATTRDAVTGRLGFEPRQQTKIVKQVTLRLQNAC